MNYFHKRHLQSINCNSTDEILIKRTLELALNGFGRVAPNPLVGALICKNGKIISEGWHDKFGGPHAEVSAITSANESIRNATLYVNLEPCCHFGKTPPCTKLIIESGIKKVVIGCCDPNPLVASNGIRQLEENGIEVVRNILKKDCERLNEVFITNITKNRPFVLYKCATTLDGKTATHTGDSKWISSKESRNIVHKLRASYSAIAVGINTILKDDPLLTCRIEDNDLSLNGHLPQPKKIIFDTNLRFPLTSRIFESIKKQKDFSPSDYLNDLVIFTSEASYSSQNSLSKLSKFKSYGVDVVATPLNKKDELDLSYCLSYLLLNQKVYNLILEGGSTLAGNFLTGKFIDKVNFFIAPKIIGGVKSFSAFYGNELDTILDSNILKDIEVQLIGEDLLYEGYL